MATEVQKLGAEFREAAKACQGAEDREREARWVYETACIEADRAGERRGRAFDELVALFTRLHATD